MTSIPDRSRPRLTTTATGAVHSQGADGDYWWWEKERRKVCPQEEIKEDHEESRAESSDFECKPSTLQFDRGTFFKTHQSLQVGHNSNIFEILKLKKSCHTKPNRTIYARPNVLFIIISCRQVVQTWHAYTSDPNVVMSSHSALTSRKKDVYTYMKH